MGELGGSPQFTLLTTAAHLLHTYFQHSIELALPHRKTRTFVNIPSYNKDVYLRCWEIAKNLWQEHPSLSKKELHNHPTMLSAIGERNALSQEMLLSELAPFYTDERDIAPYMKYEGWTVEECVAIWLNLNPRTLEIVKKDRTGIVKPYGSTLISNASDYLEQAKRAASVDLVAYVIQDGAMHIRPKDFFRWAIGKWGEPFGSLQRQLYREVLESSRTTPATSKPSKVDLKKAEIASILDRLSVADTHFDRLTMPGKREDFQNLCIQINQKMFSVAPETFNDYLVGLCTFSSGARETDYYSRIATKLG